MNEAELRAAALLGLARRGLSPSSEDAQRVRASLGPALASGANVPTSSRAAPRAGGALRALPAVAKLGLAMVLAAATGVGGYVLGFRAGSAFRTSQVQRAVEPSASATSNTPLPNAEAAPLASSAAPSSARPMRGRSSSMTASAAPRAAASSGESLLETETRLLARVQRALRDQNPRLALGLLGELDLEVPGGQLGEERQAGRVVAHCELGSASAAKFARDFTARYPASAYAPRVQQACAESRRDDSAAR